MIGKIFILLLFVGLTNCANGYKPVPEKLELQLPLVGGPKFTMGFEKIK